MTPLGRLDALAALAAAFESPRSQELQLRNCELPFDWMCVRLPRSHSFTAHYGQALLFDHQAIPFFEWPVSDRNER